MFHLSSLFFFKASCIRLKFPLLQLLTFLIVLVINPLTFWSIHLLSYTFDNEHIGTHDVGHDTLHALHVKLALMCLDALNSFQYVHWCVDIVNFKDEVLIFMDIVMVSPTRRYLLPRWIPIRGIVAWHIQRKGVTTIPHKRLGVPSSCVKIFSSICRQSVGVFHTYARKAWAPKLKEGLLVQWRWFSYATGFYCQKVQASSI